MKVENYFNDYGIQNEIAEVHNELNVLINKYKQVDLSNEEKTKLLLNIIVCQKIHHGMEKKYYTEKETKRPYMHALMHVDFEERTFKSYHNLVKEVIDEKDIELSTYLLTWSKKHKIGDNLFRASFKYKHK